MSRARLGLYVFGRLSLFKACSEMAPVLNVLCQRPTELCLTGPLGRERYDLDTFRRPLDQPYQGNLTVAGVEDMQGLVKKLLKQVEKETEERAQLVV